MAGEHLVADTAGEEVAGIDEQNEPTPTQPTSGAAPIGGRDTGQQGPDADRGTSMASRTDAEPRCQQMGGH